LATIIGPWRFWDATEARVNAETAVGIGQIETSGKLRKIIRPIGLL